MFETTNQFFSEGPEKKKKTSVGLGISSFVPQLKKCQRINRFEARDLRVVEDTIEIYTYLGKL